jgi:uncharacterized integral membrane protein
VPTWSIAVAALRLLTWARRLPAAVVIVASGIVGAVVTGVR